MTQRVQQKRQQFVRAGADGHPESENRLLHKSQHSNLPNTGSKHTCTSIQNKPRGCFTLRLKLLIFNRDHHINQKSAVIEE